VSRELNVLVLGVGGNVSQSIEKALALSGLPLRLIAACVSPSSAGLYMAERAYLSPLARDAAFIPWLAELCLRERIDAVLSGSEIVLEELAPHAERLREQTGAVAIVSPPDVLARGRDKLLTCTWLEAQGLPVPAYALLSDREAVQRLVGRCGFPLIAKPRFGKGSDGILVLRDEEELGRAAKAEDLALRQIVDGVGEGDLLLQQQLGEESGEFTAGCFCDRHGALKGTIVLRRALRSGTTVMAQAGEYPAVTEVAGQIARALGPLGPCNVQLRVHEGQPIPFEINPRFSGTTALRARLGFNEVEAALRHFVLGEPAPALRATRGGVALRYWNEVYVGAAAYRELEREGSLENPRPEQMESWGWGG
jgi:carbamoyl-phosphate synthase large subunit